MKGNKRKNIIIGILVAIIVVLLVVIFVICQDNFNYNETEKFNNIQIQNDNNAETYDESDFIRQTNIILVDEPNCTGNSSSLVANIEDDGNISVSQNGGAILITPGNAKYLYRVGKLTCDAVDLYYITEDNNLYKVENNKLTSGIDQVAVKVTESKVVEFLGTEVKEVADGYEYFVKVLLENNEVEYINYLTTVK